MRFGFVNDEQLQTRIRGGTTGVDAPRPDSKRFGGALPLRNTAGAPLFIDVT